MGTLLERARAFLSSKTGKAGALAIVPLAAIATAETARGDAFTFSPGSSSAFIHVSGGGDIGIGTVGATGGNPLVLYSSGTINVSNTTYHNDNGQYVALRWTGTLDPSYFPAGFSTITIPYFFSISAGSSGGSVSWTLQNLIGGVELDTSGSVPVNGAQEFSGTLSTPVTTTLSSTWLTELDMGWTGMTSPSTLAVDVPAIGSIDLGVTSVPEPASLGMMGLGVLGLLSRRRRWA